MKVRKKAVLCAILAGIMLSTATPSLKLTVFADSAITETEALDKAVALYEHLTDKEVEIPQGLDETGLDTNLIKPIVLGYINFEDTEGKTREKYNKTGFYDNPIQNNNYIQRQLHDL